MRLRHVVLLWVAMACVASGSQAVEQNGGRMVRLAKLVSDATPLVPDLKIK